MPIAKRLLRLALRHPHCVAEHLIRQNAQQCGWMMREGGWEKGEDEENSSPTGTKSLKKPQQFQNLTKPVKSVGHMEKDRVGVHHKPSKQTFI